MGARLAPPPPLPCLAVLTAGAFLLISLIGRHSARQQTATWWKSWEVRRQLEEEEEHNDAVLSLLMPPSAMEAAKNLENESMTFAEKFADASILFVEICGLFTDSVAERSPEQTMGLLNTIFWELDELTEAAGLLKVETVGSVYMVRGPYHTLSIYLYDNKPGMLICLSAVIGPPRYTFRRNRMDRRVSLKRPGSQAYRHRSPLARTQVASGMPDRHLPDHCARLAALALDMLDALTAYEDDVGRPLQVSLPVCYKRTCTFRAWRSRGLHCFLFYPTN